MLLFLVVYDMGRIKRGNYLIEWWIGDHLPKHVHIYKNGNEIAKIQIPAMRILSGRMNKQLRKILKTLIAEKKI